MIVSACPLVREVEARRVPYIERRGDYGRLRGSTVPRSKTLCETTSATNSAVTSTAATMSVRLVAVANNASRKLRRKRIIGFGVCRSKVAAPDGVRPLVPGSLTICSSRPRSRYRRFS